jgi:Protein of unknown function (DUF998)
MFAQRESNINLRNSILSVRRGVHAVRIGGVKGIATKGRSSYYGPALYIVAAFQFIFCIAVTASRYGPPAYNPLTVTISDLQAVNCGTFQGAQVCSPLHDLANVAVGVLGLLIVIGSLLLRSVLPGGRRKDAAVVLLVVAGLSAFANAFTPEDVTWTGDLVTALIAFLGANFGLIQIGRAMSTEPLWRDFRLFTQGLGTVGAVSLILDGIGLGTAIGTGAVEWLIVAPMLIWAPAIGLHLIFETRSTGRKSTPPPKGSVHAQSSCCIHLPPCNGVPSEPGTGAGGGNLWVRVQIYDQFALSLYRMTKKGREALEHYNKLLGLLNLGVPRVKKPELFGEEQFAAE